MSGPLHLLTQRGLALVPPDAQVHLAQEAHGGRQRARGGLTRAVPSLETAEAQQAARLEWAHPQLLGQ